MRAPNLISVVSPCYNEEGNLRILHERLTEILAGSGCNYEILLVDDGSRDGTLGEMRRIAREDSKVKYLSLSRNFGHEAASSAGLDAASGGVVILIDADLQDPPEVILRLLEKWREGYDVVYAVRSSREGEGLLKKTTSHLFYRLINYLSKPPLPVDTGDFRLMDRKAVDALKTCRERSRFVRGLSSWVGFRQTGIPYKRERRFHGKTKYDYLKLTLLAIEAISSFSIAPLRMSLLFGCLGIAFAAALSSYILFVKIFFGISPQGYTLLILTILFMGSMNIFLLGVIAEYLGKVFVETQNRPLYIVGESNL